MEGLEQVGEGGVGGGRDVGADGGDGGDQGGDLARGELDRGDGRGDVEAEATAGAAAGGDGDAGVAEAGDVTLDGADVDPERDGQLFGGGVAAAGPAQLLDQAVLAVDPEPGQVRLGRCHRSGRRHLTTVLSRRPARRAGLPS